MARLVLKVLVSRPDGVAVTATGVHRPADSTGITPGAATLLEGLGLDPTDEDVIVSFRRAAELDYLAWLADTRGSARATALGHLV